MVDEERMRPGDWLCFGFLSVLCHCLLGDRKDIRPVKHCHLSKGSLIKPVGRRKPE